MVTIEIFAIGNELLIGDVLDTNSHWVIKKITGMGGQVNRSAILPDEKEVIAPEIQGALLRKTEVIFTIGGMGPTADDLTLAAIAQAIDQPLEPHAEAMALVQQKYQELAQKGYVQDATLTPAREKMGILPKGSFPIPNPVGAAPAVISLVQDSMIMSLPGVPQELKTIFDNSLLPLIQEKLGDKFYLEKETLVRSNDESAIAPLLQKVAQNHPQVYIKSRAKQFERNRRFQVTFAYCGESKAAVMLTIDQAIQDWEQELDKVGISLEHLE